MVAQVIFICHTCQHTNYYNLDTPGFEDLPYKFESLTEAVKCAMAGHHVYTEINFEDEL